MDLLRVYLFSGLVLHKALWEFMKRKQHGASVPKLAQPLMIRAVKLAKIGILAGIVLQTLVPSDVLPITTAASGLRLAGAILFAAGLAIAIAGRVQLGSSWSDIETPGQVSKPALVSHGLYRYIRHPIYTGDILVLIGLELALNSWFIVLVGLMTPLILRQAVGEERLLGRSLPGYEDYCQRTKRFVPFLV